MSEDDEERMCCLVDLNGNDDAELVTAADCLDNIMEDFARNKSGYVRRDIGCNTCHNRIKKMQITKTNLSEISLCDYEEDRLHDTQCSYKHKLSSTTIKILEKIQEIGNFRNFQEISVQKEEMSYFEEALKIQCDEPLKIIGRLSRPTDFIAIADYLKTKEMVSYI